jgi:hypothetical protein
MICPYLNCLFDLFACSINSWSLLRELPEPKHILCIYWIYNKLIKFLYELRGFEALPTHKGC